MCPYCSKCSLEQYLLDKGCPNATGKTQFPYLNTPHLSEEDRMALEDTLVSAAKDLRKHFARTDNYIAQNLHADVTLVKNFALNLVRDLTEQKEDEAKINEAKSIPEISLALQPYKSFLNYEVIESIATEYGSPEIRTKMQMYVAAFTDFCKRSAFKIPISALHKQDSKRKEKVISVKYAKTGLASLSDIVSVRQKMASVLGIKNGALKLRSIEDGCVCVRFLVPAAVMSKIFPLSPAKISALEEVGISIEEEQALKKSKLLTTAGSK